MDNKSKLFFFFSIFLLFGLFISCSDSVGPNFYNLPFVSLSVGDERQFIFTTDSSTVTYAVKNELFRSDGLKTFVYEWYYGTDTIPRLDYYAIKDGFFISTELDTVKDTLFFLPDNPFGEQRLAKLYPTDGDTWDNIVGDSSSTYFVAKSIGLQKTPAGLFYNCFSFTLDNILSVNYSEGIGHISSILLGDSTGVLSNYIKVNGKIYGNKIPPKDPIFPGTITKRNSKILFDYLLGKY